MSGTYKALGINLKSAPLGESDRLLTVLTEEFGLVRAVAPGARKHKSSLGGRSGLFVVNHLLIAKGKSLDKITQAETLESYPGLSQNLSKLTAAQYLAELVLCQALSDQPQPELLALLREHLSRLETSPAQLTIPCLVQAIFHLLTFAGLSPQVQTCCVTQQPVCPNFNDLEWRIGFSVVAGGVFDLSELERFKAEYLVSKAPAASSAARLADLYTQLTAIELDILQQLTQPNLLQLSSNLPILSSSLPILKDALTPLQVWFSIERILRQYAQYHFDRPIRSATLIDACFADALSPVTHNATL